MAVVSSSAALVVVVVMYCSQVSESSSPDILVSFEDTTLALGQSPVTQTCVIRGDILFVRVNGTLVDHITRGPLEDKEVIFSNQQFYPNGTVEQSVSVAATVNNNNTVIQCIASSTGYDPVFSDNATFIVAGPPLPPSLSLETVNESALQVSWEEPFSLDFPITRYRVVINDFISDDTEEFNVSANTHSFTYTSMNLSLCTNLTFMVFAVSEVGNSPPGYYTGAFSSFPGQFTETPSSRVTFFRNQAPILHLNFTIPSLCPFTNASYCIYINDYGSGEVIDVVGPVVLPWQMSGMEVVMTMEDNSLKLNTKYNGNITVSTDVGHTSAFFEIDTGLPTVDGHQRDPGNDWIYWIVAACVGTAAVMSIAALIVIFIIYIYKRNVKRKRDCCHTTELAAHVGRGMPMVVNPIYEGGDTIYEEIPGELDYKGQPEPLPFEREEGYVSISTSATLNRSESAAEKMNAEKGRDELYTKMDSVGTLMGHLRGGGASAMGSPDQQAGAAAATFFPSSCDGGGAASASWQAPEQDGRYVIIN